MYLKSKLLTIRSVFSHQSSSCAWEPSSHLIETKSVSQWQKKPNHPREQNKQYQDSNNRDNAAYVFDDLIRQDIKDKLG